MSSTEAICPLCKQPNHCGATTGTARCWCCDAEIPPALLAQVPVALRGIACICRSCVDSFHRKASPGTNNHSGGPTS